MATLRAAAEQLARADSIPRLVALANSVGCSGVPASLDERTQRDLGLPPDVNTAQIVRGAGSLRALLLEVRCGVSFRDLLTRLSARLSVGNPHVLWIIFVTESNGEHVAIAAWSQDRKPPRVAALLCHRARIRDSDAETLRLLGAARGDLDILIHARWVEILGRESLTRRFYRTLQQLVGSLADSASSGTPEQRSTIALLYTSRLLFLAFLEGKGWLDGDRDFLSRSFDRCMARGGAYHKRVLLPLFFGTLNTPPTRRAPTARAFGHVPFLNGGLFARSLAERGARRLLFSDPAIGALFGELFGRYQFTAREESAVLAEVAIDPEMLGRAFESLMGSRDRSDSGAFYTPFALVERVTAAGLQQALANGMGDAAAPGTRRERNATDDDAVLARCLARMTVLDPACGSGAFLVHALERLSDLRRTAGDSRPLSLIRREVLTRSIFGIDVNPTAVWLCELRLWLSVVIGSDESDPMAVPPLPNLDRNIRVGDSLAGPVFGDHPVGTRGSNSLTVLRDGYCRATGKRKEARGKALEREERRRAIAEARIALDGLARERGELLVATRSRDLFGERGHPSTDVRRRLVALRRQIRRARAERSRLAAGGALPFSFGVYFGDIGERGGFDLIIGNPPWIRLHRVTPSHRVTLRKQFRVFREAGWPPGAEAAGTGSGFGGQVDVAALFIERSLGLLRPLGTLALLVPVKLWHSLAGGGVRRLLMESARIGALEDYSEAQAGFDAVVYPSLIIADRGPLAGGPAASAPPVRVTASRRGGPPISWTVPQPALPFDTTGGSPWLVLPATVRNAFDAMRNAGVPMATSPIGRPYLGIKCGLNEAYIVRAIGGRAGIIEVESSSGHMGRVEQALLRPLVRGEGLRAWRRVRTEEYILWTHDEAGAPLPRLPEHAGRWLAHWKGALNARTDLRDRNRWWSLFRVDSARNDCPRVIWADVGRSPRATVVGMGDPVVPLNSCYVARCIDDTDALAFVALLNSPQGNAWLTAIAEPARGGYRRFLGWTLAIFPVPRDWRRARVVLRPFGERAMAGEPPPPTELADACSRAYELPEHVTAPLVGWCSS